MAGAAVDHYNELIESRSDLLDESRSFLLERFEEVRLVFGGRTLSPYLRPHFVTRDEWTRIAESCQLVWSAIEKVGRIAPGNRVMLEQLGLTEGERELVAIDPGSIPS
jgi:hypothetical protein